MSVDLKAGVSEIIVVDARSRDAYAAGAAKEALFAVIDYEQAVEPFLNTDRLSDTERAMLMGAAPALGLMVGRRGKHGRSTISRVVHRSRIMQLP